MKIKVWKNDNWETLSFQNGDQLPGIRNSRTIVPISIVLNYLGFETRWITTGVAGDPSILRAEKGNEKIVIYDGESYFDVTTTYGNEEDCIRYVFPEYAPRTYLLVGGEFMTQIRDVLESVCYTVGWEDKPKTVKITPPTDKQNSVKYNYNYGEKALIGVPYFDITLKGHSITLPSPTQKGYIFDGWYTAKDGGERVGNGNDEYTPAKSETLYAHWIAKNNHRLSDAFDVGIDDRIFSSISQSEKLDFYRITFEGSGNVEFRLTMPQNADYSLHLLDENAGVLDRAKEKIDRTRSVTFNVQAGVPYIVRIGAVYPSDIVENENYVLEFVPTGAEAISLDFSDNQIISTPVANLSYTTTPPNAYVKCNYELYGSDATLNQSNNTLHASKNTAVILTVKAQCHNANGRELSESKLIVFDLYTAPYAVNIPNDRRCNCNQKHSGVVNLYGKKACTLISGLDIANIYADVGTQYTPEDMSRYWDKDNGFKWSIPGPGRLSSYFSFNNVPDNVSTSLAAEYIRQCYICYIKNEIYNGRPVMVNLGPNRKDNHSVVAYKCMDTPVISRLGETPTEMNKIQVFDPENGNDVSNIEGRDVTLWEAFRFSFTAKSTSEFVIWSLCHTYRS